MATSRVTIVPGTPRDLSYIAAHMRAEDAAEIYCQLPEGTTSAEVAGYAFHADPYVARLDGQPVVAFGAVPRSVCVMEAWAWGTAQSSRAFPAITRFIRRELAPTWIANGIRRLEARSLSTHVSAHRWMTSTGARVEGECRHYGRNGETFLMLAWTIEDIADVLR